VSDPFRNDHEAAIARADALENENRRLRAQLARRDLEENARTPPAPASRAFARNPWAAIVLGGIVVGVGIGVAASGTEDASSSGSPSTPVGPQQPWSLDHEAFRHEGLRGCITNARGAMPIDWHSRSEIAIAIKRPAQESWICQDAATRAQSDSLLSPVVKTRLVSWLEAEAQRAEFMERIAALPPSDNDAVTMPRQRELDLVNERRTRELDELAAAFDAEGFP
jgi:hypothetical protein